MLDVGVAVPIPNLPSSSKRANSESKTLDNLMYKCDWTSRSTIPHISNNVKPKSEVENSKPDSLNEPPPSNSISPLTTSFVLEPLPSAVSLLPPITTIPGLPASVMTSTDYL